MGPRRPAPSPLRPTPRRPAGARAPGLLRLHSAVRRTHPLGLRHPLPRSPAAAPRRACQQGPRGPRPFPASPCPQAPYLDIRNICPKPRNPPRCIIQPPKSASFFPPLAPPHIQLLLPFRSLPLSKDASASSHPQTLSSLIHPASFQLLCNNMGALSRSFSPSSYPVPPPILSLILSSPRVACIVKPPKPQHTASDWLPCGFADPSEAAWSLGGPLPMGLRLGLPRLSSSKLPPVCHGSRRAHGRSPSAVSPFPLPCGCPVLNGGMWVGELRISC